MLITAGLLGLASSAFGQTIYKTDIAPVIDGEADLVWNLAERWDLTIRADRFDPSDLSASVQVLWDDANIYYLVRVMDDELSDDSEEALAWQDDSVEIYIDGGNEKASSYDANDAQLTLRRTMRTEVQGSSHENYADKITWMTSEIEGGYLVEMALSLTDFPQVVAEGTEIGIEVQINDDDDGGEGDGLIKWMQEGPSFRDPSIFGTATFTELLVQRRTQTIYKAPAAPVIDGEIDSVWTAVEPWPLLVRSGGVDPANRSGLARMLWDEDFLYYLVDVTDDLLSDDSAEEQPWEDDSVEIYIDADNSKGESYDANDAQLTLRRTMRTDTLGVSHENYDGLLNWTVAEREGGYVVEMSLSLEGFAQTPGPGILIGIGFQINDDDDGGGNDGVLKAFDVVGQSWRQPLLMGTGVFSPLEAGAQAQTWLGFPVDPNGDADTGDWMGWFYVPEAPWVYSYSLDRYVYTEEVWADGFGTYLYIPR